MITPKRRVLIVTQHYLPGWKAGGPVRSIANMIEHLGHEFEFRVITLDRDIGDQQPYSHITDYGMWYQHGKALVKYLAPNRQALWYLLQEMRSSGYDLLYVNGLLSSFSVFAVVAYWLKLSRIQRLILAPRGHLELGAMSIKPRKKQLFFKAAKALNLYREVYWHAASHNEREDILRMLPPVKSERVAVVPNLLGSYQSSNRPKLLKKPGSLDMVFFSRISRKKNLDFALSILSSGISGQVKFDIYGTIEDTAYWEQCKAQIAAMPSNITVRYCGEVKPDDVLEVLSQYHLFFLPTRGENFGHVIYEALAAGCPVLISDQTPWNNVNDEGAGWALPLQDGSFRDIICHIVSVDEEVWQTHSHKAYAYSLEYVAKSNAVKDTRQMLNALANSIE